MLIPGYELIEELAQQNGHTLYRGRRVEDQRPVLLKLPRHDPPSWADLELLQREYALLNELAIAGIPRACELLRYGNRCCLLLEDHGGLPLANWLAARPCELGQFFQLAIQLATILAELHRRELIHQRINPRNILFDPASGAVWLTELQFAATGTPRATLAPQLLGDALVYLSPEQSGRMNRAVDYRADFYALGVTFYELLTGQPPFRSADALELLHWHIAKPPLAPVEINPAIPAPLSQLVLKLLAKTAEERYQSALGLRADLEQCARDWLAQGQIAPFELGRRDIADRFLIPQKLYGRAPEVAQLLGAFDRVCQGAAPTATLLLVAGYSGIGKSSLIQELSKPILRQQGYFISGKFDQVARSVPFSALIQAFRDLVRQLLTESEERLEQWRNSLATVLGANGGLLAEVIPEIELIIGQQPPAPVVGAAEALNRFQLVLQNFVAALARQEHPLVVFLDDLQWADAATLNLLQPLLTSPELCSLFLIGAYRDNEVDAAHLLARTLDVLEAAGVELQRVTLGPLRLADLTSFVRDTLYSTTDEAEPLAQLLLAKTGGNPFFSIQFLKTLQQEGFLQFDYEQGRWVYNLDDIARAPLTDNVIDLMTRKLQRLPEKTQRSLTLAACIGNPFDQHTLAIVSQQAPEAVADDLKEALQEGLLLPGDGELPVEDNPPSAIRHPPSYVFLHDRVQQAAYDLIPAEWKQPIHLTMGRLLLEHRDLEQSDAKLFELVHHFNLGSGLLADAERVPLARLNLQAGQKAKASTAYAAALGYLQAGVCLLEAAHWQSEYELCFALQLEAAECAYLCGQFEAAEARFTTLLAHAATKLDQAKVYRLRMVQYENLARYSDALASAHEGLALFGVNFPTTEAEKTAALERALAAIQAALGERPIASLIELPVLTDPAIRMVMNILTDIWASTYILGDALLARLISATMVRLSLQHGNAEESAYGYVTHAITVGPVRADYAAAYEFGKLALRVNEKFNDARRCAKIHQQFHAHVLLWREPLRNCITHAQAACRSGLETGDFLYAAYGASTEAWPALGACQDLAQFVRELTPNLALIRKLKINTFADALQLLINWAQALRGETHAPLTLSNAEFDEHAYAAAYRDNPFFSMFYAVAKLQLAYLLGDYKQALAFTRNARGLAQHLAGTIWPVWLDFWGGLALAANYADADETARPALLNALKAAQASLAVLAENCPANFRCHALLLAAEIERLEDRTATALDLYERAVHYAGETGLLQQRAVANELCGKFQLSQGREKLAAVLLAEARACYALWGATTKVAELESRYPNLLRQQPDHALPQTRTAQPSETSSLDLFSVLKAAQAIASEIELDKLLAKLLRIAIENAGAERGHLLLKQTAETFVHAAGSLERAAITLQKAVALNEAPHLPGSLVHYVQRTSECVVLADAQRDDRFSHDHYIARQQVRSVLCIPVLKEGRCILYLENNQVSGAFTPAHIQMMQMLSAQAAISLENALLYDEMRQAEATMRAIASGTAAVTGDDFFASLVRHLAAALEVRYAFVTECRGEPRARTLAFWTGDKLAANLEYEIAETPCVNVLAGQVCHYPQGVQQLFPGDRDLIDLGAVGYLGVPLYNAAKAIIGHLAVLDDKPLRATPRELSLLQIFAARAGAELERQRADAQLRVALAEVERLKNRLHAENVYLQEEIGQEHNFAEIVGSSPALLEVLRKVEVIAPTDSTVIVYGETGTGKELIARALHNRSTRKERPLVKVNCGAISAGLVESELFGHVKGAFTGAFDRRTGRFELADGGTLFLDEVGELPLETQVKLLRVLQEGEFEPVGSSRTVRVDVRLIAATNRNLEDEVRAGRFRADLFYRLNVLTLHMPALRERRSDIPQLVMFFLSRCAKKFGKRIAGVSQETLDLLSNYAWPGNVRELQNIIERGVVLSPGPILSLSRNLFPADAPREEAAAKPAAPIEIKPTQTASSLAEIERQHILAVLEQSGWVIEGQQGAARVLNLHPNTLRSRLKKLGIQRPRAGG